MDPQSAAFREATEVDCWDGDVEALIAAGGRRHEPLADAGHIVGPDEYEAAGWDDGREPPKSISEARAALRARITDPTAPDGDAERHAYDGDGI